MKYKILYTERQKILNENEKVEGARVNKIGFV